MAGSVEEFVGAVAGVSAATESVGVSVMRRLVDERRRLVSRPGSLRTDERDKLAPVVVVVVVVVVVAEP